jgi:uncharacterized protein YndB with AHSA1/START domain
MTDTVEIRRQLDSSPERVFAAFADAHLLARWLKPSPDITLAVLKFDFRVGGAYRFAYSVPSGVTMTVNGIYHVIEPPTKLVFSWVIEPPDEHAGLDSVVRVVLTARHGGGSELLIRHERLTLAESPARHAQGWQGALEQLAILLTQGAIP